MIYKLFTVLHFCYTSVTHLLHFAFAVQCVTDKHMFFEAKHVVMVPPKGALPNAERSAPYC